MIKKTMKKEMLEDIQSITTPKEAWDILGTCFSRKNYMTAAEEIILVVYEVGE